MTPQELQKEHVRLQRRHKMVRETPLHHADFQKDGKSAKMVRAGIVAGITRDIEEVEYLLYRAGEKFTPWTAPVSSSGSGSSRKDIPESQVVAELTAALQTYRDDNAPQRVRETADAKIRYWVRAAETREYLKVPEGPTAKTYRDVAAAYVAAASDGQGS